jgi:hypothetical protein
MPRCSGYPSRSAICTGIIAAPDSSRGESFDCFRLGGIGCSQRDALEYALNQTGYVPANGLRMYYEVHGPANAVPLVLLHGGGDTIETSFGQLLPALARARRISAFEQQGCGRTTDIPDRPFSFEQSVDDTVAILDYLRIDCN